MSIKILTVDDSKTIRLIVAKAFKPFDCVILEAANGAEGLQVAAREIPDVIILDITMPVMDGYEALTKLKADPNLKAIPVIMMTAEAGKENIQRIFSLGVKGYVLKPFKEEIIVERVRGILKLTPRQEIVATPKKVDDAVHILVVEDKPVIVEQIRSAFASTPWKVFIEDNAAGALAASEKSAIHIAIVSLSLPDNASTTLFQNLRARPRTKTIPVLGLSVKTPMEEQARWQQLGFAGIVTKPIAFDDLKNKICRALSLDTSSQYFQQQGGALIITLPVDLNQSIANLLSSNLHKQANTAVDSGLDKMIIDLSRLETADIVPVKLTMEAIENCQKVGLKYGLIGSPAVNNHFKNFEEFKSTFLATSFEEAMLHLCA
jgi:CheY-like chemotaxis protein